MGIKGGDPGDEVNLLTVQITLSMYTSGRWYVYNPPRFIPQKMVSSRRYVYMCWVELEMDGGAHHYYQIIA